MESLDLKDLLIWRVYLMRLKGKFLSIGIIDLNKEFHDYLDFINGLIKLVLDSNGSIIYLTEEQDKTYTDLLKFEERIFLKWI